jgi:hypothetical protein
MCFDGRSMPVKFIECPMFKSSAPTLKFFNFHSVIAIDPGRKPPSSRVKNPSSGSLQNRRKYYSPKHVE